MGQCSCICCKADNESAIVEVDSNKLQDLEKNEKEICEEVSYTKKGSLKELEKGGGLGIQGSITLIELPSVAEKSKDSSNNPQQKADELSLEIDSEKKPQIGTEEIEERTKKDPFKSKKGIIEAKETDSYGPKEIILESTTAVVMQKIKQEKESGKGRNVRANMGEDLSKPKIDLIKVCDKKEAFIPVPLYEDETIALQQRQATRLGKGKGEGEENKIIDIPL